MTRLFRSKSCGGVSRSKPSFFHPSSPNQDGLQLQQDEQEDEDDVDYYDNQQHYPDFHNNPITTPFISPDRRRQSHSTTNNNNNFTILALLLAALRKSLVTCSIDDSEDVASSTSSLDIGCPTDVRHVSHVTFDRFNGFLGLPVELQPDVPHKVPSASVSVFGVSAESMQCSHDERGNSVPMILLMMQKRLYSGGGLQAEGIFRINAENSQEEDVRKQLNRGFVPHEIDVHCLAGLIKAWFRELPRGVLDTLTPEQVMHCNTEEECDQLVKSLPPTEAALLDWAINLMADVVKHEQDNKMNARNIAMVFAPNMTQMADPLTALIHAVQVMNLLKTLVIKTLGEREESPSKLKLLCSSADPPPAPAADSKGECPYSLRSATLNRLGSESEEQFWSFPRKSGSVADYDYMSGKSSPAMCKSGSVESDQKLEQEQERGEVVEGILERLSLRKGVRRLCRHPVFQFQFQFQFQLSKPVKKSTSVIVDTRSGGGEAWT